MRFLLQFVHVCYGVSVVYSIYFNLILLLAEEQWSCGKGLRSTELVRQLVYYS